MPDKAVLIQEKQRDDHHACPICCAHTEQNPGQERQPKNQGVDLGADSEELRQRFEREKRAWELYYDALSALERSLENSEEFAIAIAKRARKIVESCKLSSAS